MSSTTNTLAKKYSAASFFRFNFRQNIQHLVLYLVIAVLVMVLPTIMMIENYYDRTSFESDITYYLIEESVQIIGFIGLFVSGGIALLSGMSSLSYVNSKQNVGCYHSFPIKRETMYLTDSLIRAIYYGVTMLFGYTMPYLIFLAALPSSAVLKYGDNYLKLVLAGVIAFLLIYAAFLLAGSLTGTAFMRFVMVLVIFFLPLAIYAILVVAFFMANENIYDTYYWNEELIQYLCTPVRAVIGVEEMLYDDEFFKLLMLIPEAAAYYIGGMFLHKFRRSESTGTTVIWKPVFMALKYIVIVICTLLGAYIFYNIEDTGISFVIGAVIGAVLSLILMNCLLYRSSKAMFKGLKPFGICCAATAVFMIFVPLNATGRIGEFYSVGNTKEITIELMNTGFELKVDDRENIEAIMAMLENEKAMISGDRYLDVPILDPEANEKYRQLDEDKTLTGYAEKYGYTSEDIESIKASVGKQYSDIGSYSMTVVQKPKFGVPLAVRVRTDANSEFTEMLLATEEYAEMMDITEWLEFEDIEEIYVEMDERQLNFYGWSAETYYGEDNMRFNFSYENAWEKALDIAALCKYDAEDVDSTVVGVINIYYESAGNTNVINYPIYAANLDLINTISEIMAGARNEYLDEDEIWQPYKTSLEYFESVDELMDNSLILLVDCATGETVELTSEEFAELGQYTVSYFTEDDWSVRHLLRYSTSKYAILYQRDSSYDRIFRFRKDAITDDSLAAYFAK